MSDFNLFGEEVLKDIVLKDEFLENPFTILDAKSGKWQARKKKWIAKGIKSEVGRNSSAIISGTDMYRSISKNNEYNNRDNYVSVFDPYLCELMYKWFAPEGCNIIDPFAGGSVRGIVANSLNYKYTGIDIRQEQVDSNIEQSLNILDLNNQPKWYVGDSNIVLDKLIDKGYKYDMCLSCPPYGNLEVYSDLEGDISNMCYNDFLESYRSIIHKTCSLLNSESFAVFVVGEFRDKDGNYVGFVPDTVKAFMDCGMKYYNEAILSTPISSASMRAKGNMKSKKIAKIHQNILVFKKL